MEVSSVGASAMMATATRQLQANTAMQTKVMKTIAQGQQQMAEMLSAIGVGQQIDTRA